MTAERLLTVPEVMGLLRVGRTTLHGLVRAGRLRVVKVGRRTLFRPAAVLAFIEEAEGRAGASAGRELGPR